MTERKKCPDGGKCHHNCDSACFRVLSCGPLSGVYEGDTWPTEIVGAEVAMTDKYLCTFCGGVTVNDTRTMDGKVICRACLDRRTRDAQRRFARVEQAARDIFPNALAEAAAKAEIAAENAEQRVLMNIIAKSRSIDRSDMTLLVDRIGQLELEAWEAGFEAAVRIAEHMGATALIEQMREALADYWETQGVGRDD